MFNRDGLLLAVCILVAAFAAPLSAGAPAELTKEKGVAVSSGERTIEFSPLIATDNFDGSTIQQPGGVILVFPFEVKGPDGKWMNLARDQVVPYFLGPDENVLNWPSSSYYSKSLNSYYLSTFGALSMFEKGFYLKAVHSASNIEYPVIHVKITNGK